MLRCSKGLLHDLHTWRQDLKERQGLAQTCHAQPGTSEGSYRVTHSSFTEMPTPGRYLKENSLHSGDSECIGSLTAHLGHSENRTCLICQFRIFLNPHPDNFPCSLFQGLDVPGVDNHKRQNFHFCACSVSNSSLSGINLTRKVGR